MTDKELQKLNRNALLELLLTQCRETEKLRSENEQLRQQLSSRQLQIDKAGSLAEASLQINRVFETAQAAAEQYLENIRMLSGRQELVCSQMQEEATGKASMIVADAKRKCLIMEKETEERCSSMVREAEEKADRIWKEAQERVQSLIENQAGLRELMAMFTKGSA